MYRIEKFQENLKLLTKIFQDVAVICKIKMIEALAEVPLLSGY